MAAWPEQSLLRAYGLVYRRRQPYSSSAGTFLRDNGAREHWKDGNGVEEEEEKEEGHGERTQHPSGSFSTSSVQLCYELSQEEREEKLGGAWGKKTGGRGTETCLSFKAELIVRSFRPDKEKELSSKTPNYKPHSISL